MTTIMTRSAAKYWWGVDLPKGVISLSQDHSGSDWIEYTTAQVLSKKRENQAISLNWKRAVSTVVPCYVWVFYVSSWIFGGWHTYVKTLKQDYVLNFKCKKIDIIEKIMDLFPCGLLPDIVFFEKWMKSFAEEYHHVGFHRGLNGWKQGLAQCWCEIDESKKLSNIFKSPKKG